MRYKTSNWQPLPHEVLRWLRAAAPRSAHLQGSESSGEVRNRRPETSGSESSAFLQESLADCYISPVSHRQFASPRLPLYCCAVPGRHGTRSVMIKRRSRILRRRTRQAALDKPRVHDGQLGFAILEQKAAETAANRAFEEKQPLVFLPKSRFMVE